MRGRCTKLQLLLRPATALESLTIAGALAPVGAVVSRTRCHVFSSIATVLLSRLCNMGPRAQQTEISWVDRAVVPAPVDDKGNELGPAQETLVQV